mmetsp:Transcript_10369/g.17374  ORF Transcript_10369/g.17374 Transcript_10369/m.17374 type:complete len:87 (+) Transcript_10369:3666-3926(+)
MSITPSSSTGSGSSRSGLELSTVSGPEGKRKAEILTNTVYIAKTCGHNHQPEYYTFTLVLSSSWAPFSSVFWHTSMRQLFSFFLVR